MAHSSLGTESEVRKHLAEWRTDLRTLYANVMLEHCAESAKTTWLELSKGVDPLIAGKAVRLRRYELDDDHRERQLGHPLDWLVLDEHDVLRSA